LANCCPPARCPTGRGEAGSWFICDGSQISGRERRARITAGTWPMTGRPADPDLQVRTCIRRESDALPAGPGHGRVGGSQLCQSARAGSDPHAGGARGGAHDPQYLPLWTRAGGPSIWWRRCGAAGAQPRVSFAVQVRDEQRWARPPVWLHALHLNEQQCNRARRRAYRHPAPGPHPAGADALLEPVGAGLDDAPAEELSAEVSWGCIGSAGK